MASMAKAMPALNQTGNNSVGGASDPSSFFMMLMTAMMENLEEPNTAGQQMSSMTQLPSQISAQLPATLMTPLPNSINPITIQAIDKKRGSDNGNGYE